DGERRDGGRGDDPDLHDVASRRAATGDDRRFEHRPRAAGVAPDDDRLLRRRAGGDHRGRGPAQRERELRRQGGVGHAAHAVGAEQPHYGCTPAELVAAAKRARTRIRFGVISSPPTPAPRASATTGRIIASRSPGFEPPRGMFTVALATFARSVPIPRTVTT